MLKATIICAIGVSLLIASVDSGILGFETKSSTGSTALKGGEPTINVKQETSADKNDDNHEEDNLPQDDPNSEELDNVKSSENENNESDLADNSACGIPPEIEDAKTPNLDDTKFDVGTTIRYGCSPGYVSQYPGGLPSVCKIDETTGRPEWTRPEVLCSPRSCGDPGYVTNGRRIGNLFTYPNKIEFKCDEGYKLKGTKFRYCEEKGEWSGKKLPTCEVIQCRVPSDPANGRVSYTSLEYGSELRYECNPGYILKDHPTRVCTSDGEWSEQEPDCIEVTCEKPAQPERGSVQFPDRLTVGSFATYLCEEGTVLVGVSLSKCLENGKWLFDPPKCLSSCKVPELGNGTIGLLRTIKKNNRNSYQEFEEFQVGTSVKHGEAVTGMCNQGYTLLKRSNDSHGSKDDVFCNDGEWSKPLQCVASNCLGDPPPMENGIPKIKKNTHGSTIWYECKTGFEKLKTGHVKCVYGEWKGYTPICGKSRCHTNELNYPGLVIPKDAYYGNSRGFIILCNHGYKKISSNQKVTCIKGKWDAESNPCTLSKCEEEPPQIQNGKIEPFDRQHGSKIQYRCDENFEIARESSVVCNVDKWEGNPPYCQEIGQLPVDQVTTPLENFTTTEAPTSSPFFVDSEPCYCTYDYPTDLVIAYSRNEPVVANSAIRKGESITLSCLYQRMDLAWTNGLTFYGNVDLTCDTCKSWSRADLPSCRPRWTGDSFLRFSNGMKILPGGTVEISQLSTITFHCINFFLEPTWNPNYKSGTYVFKGVSGSRRNNGYYSEYLKIDRATDSHAGKYDCYYSTYRETYRPTSLILEIIESEIQCPFLETNTNRGVFDIQYENDRKVNSVATYTCREFTQKLINERKRTCMADGRWSGSYPTCEDITCLSIPTYNSLVVAYTNDNKVNSRATFRCDSNAKLIGENSAICMPNGRWSNSRPTCEMLEIRCPLLDGKGIFSIYYDSGRKIGSNAHFHCIGDVQKVSGCGVRTCQKNGEWSGDEPTCVVVKCNLFETTKNLEVFYNKEDNVGSIATFSCHSPFKLVGNQRARCLQNGTWNHALPVCETSKCYIEDLIHSLPEEVNPDLRNISTAKYVPYGTELQLLCGPNSFLSGSPKTKCGSDGRWELEVVSCTQSCTLEGISSYLLVDPLKENYLFAEEITFSCPPGLKLNSKIQRVMCLGTKWSNPIPDCVEAPSSQKRKSQ